MVVIFPRQLTAAGPAQPDVRLSRTRPILRSSCLCARVVRVRYRPARFSEREEKDYLMIVRFSPLSSCLQVSFSPKGLLVEVSSVG